jgi:glycolate oxidase iron-sulfur subunit
MQTRFNATQLADPEIRESEKILRACVHCGFCTATCPTYVLLGDELDSPRGRIYLIKEMLEHDRTPTGDVVKHIDRCLSCLACMTTCPSGVNYMHLIDHARHHIEERYTRPPIDRLLRASLAFVLARPWVFRLALIGAALARPFGRFLPRSLRAMLALAPRNVPGPSPLEGARTFPAEGQRRKRVALLAGCAQQVLAPEINEATVRLLTRLGCEVVVATGSGCCGSLAHHLGHRAAALDFARANIDAWEKERSARGLDAIVVNASGCGTTVKDYGFMLRHDSRYAARAETVAKLALDVTELLAGLGLPRAPASALRVAYHSACSMQHGQRVRSQPKELLSAAGFTVLDVPEGHLCCGSAGTYNLLQPEIAARLRDRKVAHIESVRPDVVATGNIGCITQIASGTAIPVLHTAELLDWATGGPLPPALRSMPSAVLEVEQQAQTAKLPSDAAPVGRNVTPT